jgi:fermentation-respiration switch protein FrsA (DUF1100 family)
MTTTPLLTPAETGEQTTPTTGRPASAFRRHRLFLGSAAVVMLHVADDNFLQPNPGVSPADHLVSGLVPLALIAAAAWAHTRVRAGARGAIALLLGLFGLTVGPIEFSSHLSEGLRADDYTGVLATVAAVVLLAVGAATLWRSRRRTPNRVKRYGRRTGLVVVGFVFLTELYMPFGMGYLTTHVSRSEVPTPRLGAPHEDVTLTTSDGLKLKGWYVPSRNGAAVIAFPGRKGPQAHTRMLVRNGYGVLLFDRRGEGASEGDINLYGWGGTRDIHAAVDFLQHRADVDPDRIGGIGFSVGGELMLQAAAENPELAAVVSEGAGTRSMSEQLVEYSGAEKLRGLHQFVAQNVGVSLFSNESPPPNLMDITPRIAPRPAYVIWAPNGGNLETMSPRYARRIGPSAEVWRIDDAKHIKGLQTHPEEYERRVVGFFDRSLPAED